LQQGPQPCQFGFGRSRSLRFLLGPLFGAFGPLRFLLGPLRFLLGPLRFLLGPLRFLLGPLRFLLGPLLRAHGPLVHLYVAGKASPIRPDQAQIHTLQLETHP
jgi:hypothetical protein